MSSAGLSSAVKQFLRNHIQSVAQIEILALVCSASEREWTAHDIDQVLRSSEESIARRLAEFVRAGLFSQGADGSAAFRYQPRDAALAAAVAETVAAYRARPVLVIETIFKPDDAAQTFADAFRIRPR